MQNKKILTLLGVLVLLVMVVSLSYAFFQAQGGDTVTRDVQVLTHTVDTLTFSIDKEIEIEATQQNFARNGVNQSDEATATAILTPNSKTGSASKNYYVYLNIPTNGTVYSSANTNSDPELLLQVFDGSNQLVTLTGLGTQKTVGTLTGYDITGKVGLYTLLDNHTISASNSTTITENYRVVMTLINHNFNQNDNTGKQVVGNIIVRETTTTFCDVNPSDAGCSFSLSYNPAVSNTITLTDGYIYHHDVTLTNGSNDGSFRYSGANPNNYVCFGSDSSTCPAESLYRIIGKIPVDVVTDETDPQNPVIEKQMIYKLIKNDYETSTSLGMTANNSAVAKASSFAGPSGNQPTGDVQGFYWSGTGSHYNTWSSSTLNTLGLNTNAYGTFSSAWQNKIAKVIWKVGGNTFDNIGTSTPMSIVYGNEITNPVTTNTQDNKTEYAAKIGLMYVSDYGYAAPLTAWTTATSSYSSPTIRANNWLYKGSWEWTISRCADGLGNVLCFGDAGSLYSRSVNHANGVRRVFYLTQNTTIDMTTHAGTAEDPYRVI